MVARLALALARAADDEDTLFRGHHRDNLNCEINGPIRLHNPNESAHLRPLAAQ